MLGERAALPYLLAGFKGPTSKDRGEEMREWRREGLLCFFIRIYAHAYPSHCRLPILYRSY